MITLDKTNTEPVDIRLEDHAWDEMWEDVNKFVSYNIRLYVSCNTDEVLDDFFWSGVIDILYDHINDLIDGI